MPKFTNNATFAIEVLTEAGGVELIAPGASKNIEKPVPNDVLKGHVNERNLTVSDDEDGDFESDDLRVELEKAQADKTQAEADRDEAQAKVATLTQTVEDMTEKAQAAADAAALDSNASEEDAAKIKDLTDQVADLTKQLSEAPKAADLEKLTKENGDLTKQVAKTGRGWLTPTASSRWPSSKTTSLIVPTRLSQHQAMLNCNRGRLSLQSG